MRGECKHVRSDLVRDITVRCNTVRAKEYLLRLACFQKITGHVVTNDLIRDAILFQFPSRETCALQSRAGFINKDMHALSLLMRSTYDPERGPPIDGCQRARVAVVDDCIPVIDERGAVFRHALVDFHIFIRQSLRFFQQGRTKITHGIAY